MQYLREFETTAQYMAAQSSLLLPNVFIVTETHGIAYNPLTPIVDHPYVEIAGVKWATMNIGASSETDFGNYYQYGKGASQYAETYEDPDWNGESAILSANEDTATQVWGSDWHMPTKEEIDSLFENTNYEWTTINGVEGGKFTDKTDNTKYVFFPAAGYYSYDYSEGSCLYWSSENCEDGIYAYAIAMYIEAGYDEEGYYNHGYPVRAVKTQGTQGAQGEQGVQPATPDPNDDGDVE